MDLPKEAVEAGERAAWEARRIHAHDANGFMLEAWGDGTVPRQNGITQEIEAALRAALPHIQAVMLRSMMEPSMEMTTFGKTNGEDAYNKATAGNFRICGCNDCDDNAHKTFGAIWQAMLKQWAAEHNIPMDQEQETHDR